MLCIQNSLKPLITEADVPDGDFGGKKKMTVFIQNYKANWEKLYFSNLKGIPSNVLFQLDQTSKWPVKLEL